VFQVGPSGYERGQTLARSVLAGRTRAPVALLWSSADEAEALARGFRTQAESLGAHVVWEGRFAPGNGDFRASIRALKRREPAVLFWDGDARQAERLVRQLAQEKVTVALCGGAGFDPQQLHSEVRALLEGAIFVGEDWKLSGELEAALAAGLPAGQDPPNRLHVRGFLAGRALAAVLGEGALCPEEVVAGMRRRLAAEPYLAERGFLGWPAEDARLTVFRVERGRAVPLQ
jgi:ABC-type branched-subunit amino acid transport system substrate-binding protein